jgi:4-hydroxybenzoate polyprenyltransferase
MVAGAYVINDIQDVSADEINKPEKVQIGKNITENTAFNLYIGCNISSVFIAFYLSNMVGKPNLTGIYIVAAITFYFYANQLKKNFLIGLFSKSFFSAIIILIVPIYELYPLINESNQAASGTLFKVIVDFAILTFLITFTRELLKDLASKDGDYNEGYPTIPIVLGLKRAQLISFILVFIMLLLVALYTYFYLWIYDLYIATGYVIAFILSPIIFILIQLFSPAKTKDFIKISRLLKYLLLFVSLLIVVITYTISSNVL